MHYFISLIQDSEEVTFSMSCFVVLFQINSDHDYICSLSVQCVHVALLTFQPSSFKWQLATFSVLFFTRTNLDILLKLFPQEINLNEMSCLIFCEKQEEKKYIIILLSADLAYREIIIVKHYLDLDGIMLTD